jgi:hypothetical protein
MQRQDPQGRSEPLVQCYAKRVVFAVSWWDSIWIVCLQPARLNLNITADWTELFRDP